MSEPLYTLRQLHKIAHLWANQSLIAHIQGCAHPPLVAHKDARGWWVVRHSDLAAWLTARGHETLIPPYKEES